MGRRFHASILLGYLASSHFSLAANAAGHHDNFHHLGEINKASLVMLVEEELVPKKLAKRIADGIEQVIAEQDALGSARSSNYLNKESTGEDLPVGIELIIQAMNPVAMVASRKGPGGPQPQEVIRMQARHNESLEAQFRWLDASRQRLDTATARLRRDFLAIK